MCDRRGILTMRLALALVVAPSVLTAQGEDPLGNVRRSTTRAYAEWREAREAWQADSLRRATLRVLGQFGGATVRSDSTSIAESVARDLGAELELLRDDLRLVLGPLADSMLARSSVSVLYDPPDARWYRYYAAGASARLDLDGSMSSRYFSERTLGARGRVRDWLDAAARDAVLKRHEATLRRWPGGAPSFRPWTDEERAIVYRGLRLSRSPVAQACHDGAFAACRVALAMLPADADTVSLWYDPALQRVQIAERGRDTIAQPMLAPLHRACVQRGDDQTCRDMFLGAGVRAPLSQLARAELLRLALVAGGPQAFGRLAALDSVGVAEALERISGVPADSLIATLHAQILQGRPTSSAPAPDDLLLAGAWIVLAMLAVSRRRIAP